jgi:hypothetical protein
MAVEPKHRLRLSEEIVSAVPWLSLSESTKCVAYVGSMSQLQISQEPVEPTLEDKLDEQLSNFPAIASDASNAWMSLARFAATTWSVTFTAEPGRKRLTIVLPRAARNLSIVPSVGDSAVIFVSGRIFEIWKAERWLEHVRSTRERLDDLIETLPDDSSNRVE